MKEESGQDISEHTRAAAQDLAGQLDKAFNIELPEPEVAFLAPNIAGKCNYSGPDAQDENVVVAPATWLWWTVCWSLFMQVSNWTTAETFCSG